MRYKPNASVILSLCTKQLPKTHAGIETDPTPHHRPMVYRTLLLRIDAQKMFTIVFELIN